MHPLVFKITSQHLSADARKVGTAFGIIVTPDVTPEHLRRLLATVATVQPSSEPDANPELRIESQHSRFLVKPSEGRLRLHSWTTRVGGLELSVDEAYQIIIEAHPTHPTAPSGAPGGPAPQAATPAKPTTPKAKIAILAALILGVNAVTAWMLVKPQPSLLPAFELLPPDKGQRLFGEVAGEYETGAEAGDRALEIGRDGKVKLKEYGPFRAVLGESVMTFQGATAGGRPALVVPARAVIEVRDPNTLVLFGDTYRRRVL
jgi:hypothetical protein